MAAVHIAMKLFFKSVVLKMGYRSVLMRVKDKKTTLKADDTCIVTVGK